MDANEVKVKIDKFNIDFETRLKTESIGRFAALPLELYHYTTAEGLKGIISDGAIWATNYRYVNDLTEYIYSNDLLREEIKRCYSSQSSLIQAVFNAILGTDELFVGVVDIFIACFCEKNDLLSQWRYYGGRGGGGYAIGLSLNDMKPNLFHGNCFLFKVNYNLDQQRSLIQFLISEFCSALEQIGRSIDLNQIGPPVIYLEHPIISTSNVIANPEIKSSLPDPLGRLCKEFAFAFLELASCFKNGNFSIEEEWRLVQRRFSSKKSYYNNVQFRISGSTIIPYVSLPLNIRGHRSTNSNPDQWSTTINNIMCGPGLNNRVTEISLKYLTAELPHDVRIEHSSIKAKV